MHPHSLAITRDLDLINHIRLAPVVLPSILEQQRERMEVVPDRHLADLVDRTSQALEILDVASGDARQGALPKCSLGLVMLPARRLAVFGCAEYSPRAQVMNWSAALLKGWT